MKRRAFLQSGLAAGLVGFGGGVPAPDILGRRPRLMADGSIRLSSNENPLGISSSARTAILEGLDGCNRYPGDSREPVLRAVAAKHGVRKENVLLGNGSTEVIQMMVQLLGPDVRIVVADPTFEDVPRYAEPFSLSLTKVPLRSDYSHDLERMHDAIRGWNGPSIVYLCNPNNPTGTLTSSAAIDEWVGSAPANVFFILDEAYFEYAEAQPEYWSGLKWVETHRNVIVVRTFSKVHGMAGLRLGYGIAHADTIGRVGSISGHNNANHLACVAAVASMSEDGHVRRSVEVNERARAVTEAVLDELTIERLPSHTNFLMHRIRGDLQAYIERMGAEGWKVGRPFPPMLDFNRVSFSLPEDMMRFADTLRGFRSRGWV